VFHITDHQLLIFCFIVCCLWLSSKLGAWEKALKARRQEKHEKRLIEDEAYQDEYRRQQAEKGQRDLDRLKNTNRKKWEALMEEKSAKEREGYRAQRAYLESIRPSDVSESTWSQWHGIWIEPHLMTRSEPAERKAHKEEPTWAEFEAMYPSDVKLSRAAKVKDWALWRATRS
jgi:hypothetical protein